MSSTSEAIDRKRALQERADRYMHDLEKAYVFLRSDSIRAEKSDGSSRDIAAIEALTEIREKLRA